MSFKSFFSKSVGKSAHSGKQNGQAVTCGHGLSVLCLVLFLGGFVPTLHGQTLVRVTTPLGNFSIELFDTEAPGTVRNFLHYLNSDRYDHSFVHRSVPGFVIQGGGFTWPEGSNSIQAVPSDAPIANEPKRSNLHGTVAMAKLPGNPDSATSEWFVNLSDNSSNLDSQNGGFTVFGRVHDGMNVVDAIAALRRISFNRFQDLPVIDYEGALARRNLVFTNMEVLALRAAPNRFDSGSGQGLLRVDAGAAGIVEISFTIESQSPDIVIRAHIGSVVSLPAAAAGYATFNLATGRLTIPALEVDHATTYRNLVFTLTDSSRLLFTLQSVD